MSKEKAKSALHDAFRKVYPDVHLDDKGYTATIEDNLIDGVRRDDFEEDLRQGNGGELNADKNGRAKFCAVHSSSALAVNCFAPFKRNIADLSLLDEDGFHAMQFEMQCSTGLRGTPPNLDLVVENKNIVVGIESKFTEHLEAHEPKFADSYEDRRQKSWDEKWVAEMRRVKEDRPYQYLDAAQLIKHAFGIKNTFPENNLSHKYFDVAQLIKNIFGIKNTSPENKLPVNSVLLYIFWEPTNYGEHQNFIDHREEIDCLKRMVAGATPAFEAMSYSELWRTWGTAAAPWLRNHLARLRARYEVAV